MPDEEKKEGEINPPGEGKLNPVNLPKEDDEDDAELLAMKDQVAKKIEEKNKNKEEAKYTEKDLEKIVGQLEKKFSKNRETEDEEFIDLLDPNAVKRKCIRVARLGVKDKDGNMVHKFVVGMKDMNTDTYSDIPNPYTYVEHPTKKGEYVPWATFICDDGTEVLYPYLSFMIRGVGVWAEVIDEKKVDISEKFGLVDVKSIDESEWNQEKTGKKVLSKALKYKTTYVCKDIKLGKMLEVSEDVVNKVEAPYADLKKYLEATK